MSLSLRLPKHQFVDLKRIVDLGSERLIDVHERLKSVSPPPLHPQRLLDAVKEVLPLDDAEPLVRQLLALQGLVRQSGTQLDDVFLSLRAAIEQHGGEVLQIDAWVIVEDAVKALAAERSVRLAATAIELTYDYANLLRRTKILTDIRPLYDLDADNIEGAVISFTLRLRYDSADGEHELSIALDEADIKSLSLQCERAVRKASSARCLMDRCNVATSISGESSDG
jgi:hypothetical protein